MVAQWRNVPLSCDTQYVTGVGGGGGVGLAIDTSTSSLEIRGQIFLSGRSEGARRRPPLPWTLAVYSKVLFIRCSKEKEKVIYM